jgi:hypothetical protein
MSIPLSKLLRMIIYRESLSIESDYLQRVKEYIDGGAGDVRMNEVVRAYRI